MPLEDPDQPEPIPAENADPNHDEKTAETATITTETTPENEEAERIAAFKIEKARLATSWETYFATARIRTKDELATNFDQVTTANELRQWGADYFTSAINVPAVATMLEMGNLKLADLKHMFTYHFENTMTGEIRYSDNKITPASLKEFKFYYNRDPNDSIFDVHFNLAINDETKAKLKAIFDTIEMRVSPWLSSYYQRQINLLETLYHEQEEGLDLKTYVDSLTAPIYKNGCTKETAIRFYRQLTPQGHENLQLLLDLKIPITFDDDDTDKLNKFDSSKFAQLKEMTPEEIEIYKHIMQLPPKKDYITYDEIVTLIQKIQKCKNLTFENFKKHCTTLKAKYELSEALDWIFSIYGQIGKFKELIHALTIWPPHTLYEGTIKNLLKILDKNPDETIESLTQSPLTTTVISHVCPAFYQIPSLSENQVQNIIKIKQRFPQWYLKKETTGIHKFIEQTTEEQFTRLDTRLAEIPALHSLNNDMEIQAAINMSDDDWLKIIKLLNPNSKTTKIIDDKDEEDKKTRSIIGKFEIAAKRLKLYTANETLLNQDLPAFSISENKHLIEQAIKAREAFDNNPEFITIIDAMLSNHNAADSLQKVEYLCSLAPLCKHDFDRFKLIVSMFEHGIESHRVDSYLKNFEIGPTKENFDEFIFTVLDGNNGEFWNENHMPWILKTFPEYDYYKEMTPKNFLFAMGAYANTRNVRPANDEERAIVDKINAAIENNKDKILKYLEDLRDEQLKKPDNDLHKFKISTIANIAQQDLPQYRFLSRTISFISLLRYKTIDLAVISSLLKKFEQKGKGPTNINYSKTELIDFYEKTDGINTSNPKALPPCLKCFDTLIPNKENFALMQNQVLKLLNIVSILASSIKGSPNNWPEFFENTATELENQSPAKQKEILMNTIIILQSSIKTTFESGLGLKNLPELTSEAINELTPSLIYLSNIEKPDEKKKAILSLFILLKILDKWDDFKAGKSVEVNEYLSDSVKEEVTEYLANRAELDIFKEALPKETEEQWIATLEGKAENMIIGETTSVADTLGDVERQNEHLLDEDNFSNDEKIIFNLVKEHGQKAVAAALVEKFKNRTFENEITKKLPIPQASDGAPANLTKLLPVWQKITRILGSLLEFTEAVKAANIAPQLKELEKALTPSINVVAIFQKLGEEMTAESGVLPITDDVEHLESLLHKNKESLTTEEFEEADAYIIRVKTLVIELNKVKDELAKKFVALHEASTKTTEIGEIFRARLSEFKKIFLLEPSERRVTLKSSMTGDLTDVIPQIRQCLGCMTKECNNDTNLTFGDRNRFSIITREAGMPNSTSISDELVTVQKTIDQGATNSGYSFVMDNIYGKSSRDILVANVLVVMKKLAAMQKISAAPPIDIFVTQAALFSCGIEQSYLEKRLREESNNFTISPITKTVKIAQSASGDGHYEIGGGFSGRVSNGEGEIKGLKISLSS